MGVAMISSNRTGGVVSAPRIDASIWMLEELRTIKEVVAADATAEELVEDNRAELAAVEHQRDVTAAYDAGYIAGQLTSASAAEVQMRGVVDLVRSAAQTLLASETGALGNLEDNLAALAVSVARQIIGREVRTSPDIIVDLVRLALTEFPVDQPLRIRINPLDLSTLSAATGNAPIRIAPDREITWLADARIVAGGCVVEGRQRIIDGRIDTGLERAYRTLTQVGT